MYNCILDSINFRGLFILLFMVSHIGRIKNRQVMQAKQLGRLPVVQFAAGGIATPADAALMMQLGCDGVFVGSGVFKSGDPARRARAIVQAVTHYSDPDILADVSCGLGEAMVGINLNDDKVERYASRSE